MTTKTAKIKAARKAKPAPKITGKAVISVCKNTTDGGHVYVQAADDRSFTRSKRGDSKAFRKVVAIGQPYDAALAWHSANPEPKPQARLAQGVTAQNSPQSAKAVADQKHGATASKGKARTGKADKAKQPSKGAERSYAQGSKKNEAKPGTWRHHMLTTIQKYTDTAAAKAAHAKSGKFSANKLDFNWANSQGYIKFAK